MPGWFKCRGGFSFAVEAITRDGIVRDAIGQQLERDEPVEAAVFGLVDHAHTAFAQTFEKPIMRDDPLCHDLNHQKAATTKVPEASPKIAGEEATNQVGAEPYVTTTSNPRASPLVVEGLGFDGTTIL